MSDTVFKYPLDLTGVSAANRVVDEIHVIGSDINRMFVPDYGPFFFNSGLIIRDASNGRILDPKVDYTLAHYYREGSDAAGQAIYSVVRIINPAVSTHISFSAQMLGGEYSYSYYALAKAVESVNQSQIDVDWGALVGVPSRFAVDDHLHGPYSLYGMKHVVESMYKISAAIRDGNLATKDMMFSQIRSAFDGLDAFTKELADGHQRAADELSAI